MLDATLQILAFGLKTWPDWQAFLTKFAGTLSEPCIHTKLSKQPHERALGVFDKARGAEVRKKLYIRLHTIYRPSIVRSPKVTYRPHTMPPDDSCSCCWNVIEQFERVQIDCYSDKSSKCFRLRRQGQLKWWCIGTMSKWLILVGNKLKIQYINFNAIG
jgi:hypothetical protein